MTLVYIFGGIFAGWAMLTMLSSERSRQMSEFEAEAARHARAAARETECYTATVVHPAVPPLTGGSKPAEPQKVTPKRKG